MRYICHQWSLLYEWLQYLASLHITDPFWSDVRGTRFDRLKSSQILLIWKDDLKYLESLQHLSSRHCAHRAQSLFDDLEHEVYLSRRYNLSQHTDALIELGVRSHPYVSMLDRLDSYLQGTNRDYLIRH